MPSPDAAPVSEFKPLSAKQMNALARKVGDITNKIEAEWDRHGQRLAKLTEELDQVYAKLGAEALDV